jgi:hypothetical protein
MRNRKREALPARLIEERMEEALYKGTAFTACEKLGNLREFEEEASLGAKYLLIPLALVRRLKSPAPFVFVFRKLF